MPMQKISTSDNSADEVSPGQQEKTKEMCPQKKTIEKILRFAAAYRAEKINENQYAELLWN